MRCSEVRSVSGACTGLPSPPRQTPPVLSLSGHPLPRLSAMVSLRLLNVMPFGSGCPVAECRSGLALVRWLSQVLMQYPSGLRSGAPKGVGRALVGVGRGRPKGLPLPSTLHDFLSRCSLCFCFFCLAAGKEPTTRCVAAVFFAAGSAGRLCGPGRLALGRFSSGRIVGPFSSPSGSLLS